METAQRLIPYPTGSRSTIIYITRNIECLQGHSSKVTSLSLEIGPLNQKEALQLLLKLLQSSPTAVELEKAKQMIRDVSGLPLAIVAIANRLRTHDSLDSITSHLDKSQKPTNKAIKFPFGCPELECGYRTNRLHDLKRHLNSIHTTQTEFFANGE